MITIDNKNFGFTLVELLVGISISVMLMISVSIFVSSGMKNILDVNKVLKNSGDFNNFSSALQDAFNSTGSGKYIKVIFQTGVLFKRDQFFSKGGFSYIGEIMQDKFYCSEGSEDTNTNHIILKTFIPFEEKDENMFSSSIGSYDKIFTATAGNYTSYALDHVVKNSGGEIIIGKGVYGDKFENGAFGTGIYLNNPTGLAMSGSILFISDTLNNRVLYYENGRIYKLLDEFDGLLEPTGLYYDNSSNKLYISNSGKGEILEYSSPVVSNNPNLNITFTGGVVNNISNFQVEFFTGVTLTGPYSTGSYTFTGLPKYEDFSTGSLNIIKYYFSDYINSLSVGPQTINGCSSSTSYYLNLNSPEKEVITCSDTNTGIITTSSGNKFNDFNNGDEINISGITPDLSLTGSYYVNLKLFDGNTLKYQKYFPYFTQGDGDILTSGDNILKVFKSGLSYPTGIWNSGGIKYNEFEKESNGTTERNYNFQNTGYNSVSDYILKTPLKSLIVDKTGNLLTIFLKYYKNYNCYNLDDNAQRSYILKKKF